MAKDGAGFIPSLKNKLPYEVIAEEDIGSSSYDGIVLISKVKNPSSKDLEHLNSVLDEASKIDESLNSHGGIFGTNLPSLRLVYSPTGPLNPDYDDVRSYKEAAEKGMKRALSAGVKIPLLILPSDHPDLPKCQLVSLLGALSSLYSGIQYREHEPKSFPKLKKIGVFSQSQDIRAIIKDAVALESARWVARDIGGGDPERMAPALAEEYVQNVFDRSNVQVSVISDKLELEKQYPLFAAVNRCASVVERHRGRVVWLKYSPKGGAAKRSIVLVGKGVTFDTGGMDVKTGGASVGMSRDKCGAAAVAGFMQLVNLLQPADTEVLSALCLVRNSIGSESYVPDEVIVSRAGKRVRIGNTDAEGRMAMADILSEAKDMAKTLPDPHLFTVATLTGHACLYAGPYSVAMDNGPARKAKIADHLCESGRDMGDPFESSPLQREDFAFHKDVGECSELLQSFNKPSVQTKRGHQGPGAFLVMASGLSECGLETCKPLKYSHLDIAGSAGDYPHDPTGSPILALYRLFFDTPSEN